METTQTQFTPHLLEHLRTWEGRSEVADEVICTTSARGLAATLGHAGGGPDAGEELAPLWHWLFFAPRVAQQELGMDGHPRIGGFMPPVPLPRRMWAGGRVRWHAPLRIGEAASNVCTIESVKHKGGRSGDLVFVTLKFEISNASGLAVTEEKDIVYREAAVSGAVPPEPPLALDRICGKPSADGRSAQLWAQNHEGRLAMQAEVHYE